MAVANRDIDTCRAFHICCLNTLRYRGLPGGLNASYHSRKSHPVMADIKPSLPTNGKSHVPIYQAPHLIATYSHLKDRSIANSDASMSYYKGAIPGDDLKTGYERMIERDPLLEEHLDGLCQALLKFRREGGKLKDRALVTWRGMLTRYAISDNGSCCLTGLLLTSYPNLDCSLLPIPTEIHGR
jgi:hypothetical protein